MCMSFWGQGSPSGDVSGAREERSGRSVRAKIERTLGAGLGGIIRGTAGASTPLALVIVGGVIPALQARTCGAKRLSHWSLGVDRRRLQASHAASSWQRAGVGRLVR